MPTPQENTSPPIQLHDFLPIFAAVFLPMFLAAVDQTLLATATPVIAADLGGLRDTSWIAVTYLLAAAAVVPLYGWLGDRLGLGRVLRYSLMIFALGSLACGLAQSLPQLIAARLLQGLGGGGLMTLSQALIGELVPPRQRGRFQGYFAATFTLAAVGGPVLGGLVVAHFSWRWLFLANIPLAALALWRLVHLRGEQSGKGVGETVDWGGLVLFPLTIAAAIYWMSSVGHRFVALSLPSGLLVGMVLVLGFILWRHERAEDQPFIDTTLLAEPAIRAVLLTTMVFAACMFALVFFLPIYMQLYLKSGSIKSGLLILPLSAGIVIGSTLCGQALAKGILPKRLPALGLGCSALALGLMAWLGADAWLIGGLGMVAGMGFGCVMPTTQVIAQTVAGRDRLGAATSLASLSRSIGAALGTTVFGAVIFALLPALPPGANAAEFLRLPPQDIQKAFHLTFALMAATAATGALVAHRAPPVRL